MKKTLLIASILIGTNLFGYYNQNNINDPYQQMNRNIQYNNMNQQSMSKGPTNYLKQDRIGDVQQPTYQTPQYNYSNGAGGGMDLESLGLSLGILGLMFLLL